MSLAECGLLDAPLEHRSRKRVVALEVIGHDADEKRCVGVARIAREAAHAVHNHAVLLAGGCHHLSSRAHAERVHATPARQVGDHLVVGSAQGGMACRIAILRPIDIGLKVLDAHPDRKRLRLHDQAGALKHAEGIARRMAARENERGAGNADGLRLRMLVYRLLYKRWVDGAHGDFGQLARLVEDDVIELRVKNHLAACLLDLLAHAAHDVHEVVGADVRLGLPKDLGWRAGVDEPLQHMACQGAFRPRRQLAVGKRARSPFAELDVGGQIEICPGVERLHGTRALVHIAAAFEHKRAKARTG